MRARGALTHTYLVKDCEMAYEQDGVEDNRFDREDDNREDDDNLVFEVGDSRMNNDGDGSRSKTASDDALARQRGVLQSDVAGPSNSRPAERTRYSGGRPFSHVEIPRLSPSMRRSAHSKHSSQPNAHASSSTSSKAPKGSRKASRSSSLPCCV